MSRSPFIAVAAVVFFADSLAAHPKIAADLSTVGDDSVNVIVQYKEPPTRKQHDRVTRRRGRHRGQLTSVNGALYSIPASELELLADDPDVEAIHPDREVSAAMDTTGASVNISAARAANLTGTGIGVAVLDSGVISFSGNIVYSQDFTGSPNGAYDAFGHGSHVAGIINSNMPIGTSGGGTVSLIRDMRGIAPGVNIISLKVLGDNGRGTDSAVIAAIDRAIALKSTYNIRVMNLSLGRPVTVSYKSDPLCLAVEKAWKSGIVVVVAAGNYGRLNTVGNKGYGTIAAPGNDPYVITVGAMKSMGTATRTDDQIASYSSKGPSQIDRVMKPDLLAPGNQIVSSAIPAALYSDTDLWRVFPTTNIPISTIWNTSGGTDTWFYRLNGTSMAAPVVTGAAALLLQKDPTLTPDQVKGRLMATATKSFPKSTTAVDPATGATYTTSYDAFTVGAGYLNIAAALANTKKPTGNSQSPTVKLVNGKATMVRPAGSAFTATPTSVLWGDSILWGESVLWGESILWGESVPWNTSTSQGYSVLWGTTGNSVLWGDANLQSTTAMNVLVRGE